MAYCVKSLIAGVMSRVSRTIHGIAIIVHLILFFFILSAIQIIMLLEAPSAQSLTASEPTIGTSFMTQARYSAYSFIRSGRCFKMLASSAFSTV